MICFTKCGRRRRAKHCKRPIVDGERRPIGLVSVRDALELLLSEVEHEGELMKEYVNCVGYR